MGNHRFKLSDMVPNAWFYMLKDMRKAIKGKKSKVHHQKNSQKSFQIKPQKESLIPNRPSYIFSSKEEAEKPQIPPLHPRASDTLFHQESICNLQLQLPPIMTKPAKKEVEEKRQSKTMVRRSPTGIHRLRIRANSPRVQVSRKSVAKQKEKEKGISKSFAVVKTSTNPQKDFRDSMVEMIKENNIRSSKELEDLLACYLLLNANEYHDVIIKVFEKIWFDVSDICL